MSIVLYNFPPKQGIFLFFDTNFFWKNCLYSMSVYEFLSFFIIGSHTDELNCHWRRNILINEPKQQKAYYYELSPVFEILSMVSTRNFQFSCHYFILLLSFFETLVSCNYIKVYQFCYCCLVDCCHKISLGTYYICGHFFIFKILIGNT